MQKVASSSLVSRSGYWRMIGVGAMLLTLMACQEASLVPAIAEMANEDAPEKESWGMHTIITHTAVGEIQSRPRLAITADYAGWYVSDNTRYQLLKQIDRPVLIHLFDMQGDTSVTVTARQMRYFESEGRLEASGAVEVHAPHARQLTTEWLVWQEEGRTIRTDRFVRITAPQETVEGYDLEATEDLATYSLGRFTARVLIQ